MMLVTPTSPASHYYKSGLKCNTVGYLNVICTMYMYIRYSVHKKNPDLIFKKIRVVEEDMNIHNVLFSRIVGLMPVVVIVNQTWGNSNM